MISNTQYTLFGLLPISKSPNNENCVERENFRVYYDDLDDFDDCVFMTPHMYEEIFGQKWKSLNSEEKLLSVVKISYNGNSIYRRYRAATIKGFKKGDFALTYRSIALLCSNGDKLLGQNTFEISKGDEDNYYRFNSNHSARMSYRLSQLSNKIGKTSLLISFISLAISIISLVIAFK